MAEDTRTPEIIRATPERPQEIEAPSEIERPQEIEASTETTRAPRESEVREQTERPSDAWLPASLLPEPQPQPGIVFRWIRTSMLGKGDNANVSMKFREGWVPCKAEEHPEIVAMSDIDSQFKGNIEIGGLMLCRAPEELMQKREEYYQQVADSQMQSVDDNFMNENDSRMPLLQPDRKTRTTFGRG